MIELVFVGRGSMMLVAVPFNGEGGPDVGRADALDGNAVMDRGRGDSD